MDIKSQHYGSQECFVYIGTYTGGSSEGIYICKLDMSSGQLQQTGIASEVENPSYLTIDAERNRLFAVNELSEFNGLPGGGLSAFAIDPSSGDLTLINQQPSYGGAPCYLSTDESGQYLLVANYMGGTISVTPIGEDGSLEQAADVIAHFGSSLIPDRQEGPHPHAILLDPTSAYAFVPDLGLDKVMQYRFDCNSGRLTPNKQPWTAVEPGSGPRHMVFHPNGRHAYVINELNSTITAYVYDLQLGVLEPHQTLSTIPKGYSGLNIAADLHLTPDGSLLFGSNRGHDSIAGYEINQENGHGSQQ